MRSFSGASLVVKAAVVLSVLSASGLALSGCAKVGQLKAMKSFKAANQAYQQQDYKKAAQLYEETVAADPNLASAYFYLGNSYDQQYKPSKKGEPENDRRVGVYDARRVLQPAGTIRQDDRRARAARREGAEQPRGVPDDRHLLLGQGLSRRHPEGTSETRVPAEGYRSCRSGDQDQA